jgi:cytochrome c oxidase assembly protein subunit 11
MAAPRSNTRLALWLTGCVFVMVAASFAAVPLYSWFCRVTGYGWTTSVADAPAPADEIRSETVTVYFDANVAPGMAWEFRPKQRSMEVRLGETGLAFYEAYNPTDRPLAGQAGYNVVPFSMGGYFDKIACFCFEMQVLQPGERVDMPVSFFVDPAMLDERETRNVNGVTLSYTMYPADLPEARLSGAEATRYAAAPTPRGDTLEQ